MSKYLKYSLLIFLVSFNLRLGIASVPPILSEIKAALHLTNIQASLLTSIPVICMGLLALTVQPIQRKMGRKMGIFFMLILLGIATLARILALTFLYLVLTTLFIGFAIAVIGPLLSGFIKEEFPSKTGIMIGLYSFGMGLGAVCASSTMLALTSLFNSWRFSLAIWGIFALIMAIIWWLIIPSEKTHTSTIKEKEPLPLRNKTVWKMVLFFGIQSGIFYSLTTWLTQVLVHKGFSLIQSVAMLTLFTATQMLASFLIPAMMDYFLQVKVWIILCCSLMLLSCILFIISESLTLLIIGILLMAIAAGGFFPIAMLLPLQTSDTASKASVWTSMVQAFGYVIGGILPILIGLSIDYSQSYTSLFFFIILGIGLLLGIGLSFSTRKEQTHG